MHQTFLARCDLHKGTKVHQAGHLALVDGTDLGVLDNRLDGRNGALRVVLIDGGDKDVAVLLNVDLAVEVGAHLLNDLAALADDVLDLVNGDHHAEHLGRILGQLGARLGNDRLDDLIEDVETAFVPPTLKSMSPWKSSTP